MGTELEAKQSTEITPMQMINNAMEKGVDADTLGKMMDLQERHEANQAKKAYVQAMNEFSANRPKILKDKEVNYNTTKGNTNYKHASLDGIIQAITPALVKFGLSYNWITKQENNLIAVTCKVTHIDGHSESTSMSAGADQSGGKNSIQAVGSTTSYLQRYTLCSILGLAASDDDDGHKSESPLIDDKQLSILTDIYESLNFDKETKTNFANWLKGTHRVAWFDKLKQRDYDDVLKMLNRKLKEKENAK